MNNASKGRCVTVTPRGIRIRDLDWRFSIQAQRPKFKADQDCAEQLAAKIEVESRGGGTSMILSLLGSMRHGYVAHDFPSTLPRLSWL